MLRGTWGQECEMTAYRGDARGERAFFGSILWEQPRVARTISALLALRWDRFLRPSIRTQGVLNPRGWRRRAQEWSRRRKGGFSLAWMMRGRFCTQRGALLERGTMARASPGSFSRPPTMVIASWSLSRYSHLLIRCFVTLASTAPEMAVLMPLPSDYPYTSKDIIF